MGDEYLQAAIVVVGLVVVAVTFIFQKDQPSREPLPGKLPPQGESVMLERDLGGEEESEETVPDEVARDFTRTFLASGGHIKLLTSGSVQGMESVGTGMREYAGNVNKEVTQKAIAEFKASLEAAMAAAKIGDTPKNLFSRVLRLLTVSPGMKVVLDHSVMPAMYQPKFLVAVSGARDKVPEVRVATFAFIGGPPLGPPDPSKKYSPFRICMVSENLLSPTAKKDADGKVVAGVKFCARACADTSMEAIIQSEIGHLQEAVSGGNLAWENYLQK